MQQVIQHPMKRPVNGMYIVYDHVLYVYEIHIHTYIFNFTYTHAHVNIPAHGENS